MSIETLLAETQKRGFRLSINGGKLHIEPWPRDEKLLEKLREHKRELLAALATENAQEYMNERTAICAADGLPTKTQRPVFEYQLAGSSTWLIALGQSDDTIKSMRRAIQTWAGGRLREVRRYRFPPPPERLQ